MFLEIGSHGHTIELSGVFKCPFDYIHRQPCQLRTVGVEVNITWGYIPIVELMGRYVVTSLVKERVWIKFWDILHGIKPFFPIFKFTIKDCRIPISVCSKDDMRQLFPLF